MQANYSCTESSLKQMIKNEKEPIKIGFPQKRESIISISNQMPQQSKSKSKKVKELKRTISKQVQKGLQDYKKTLTN